MGLERSIVGRFGTTPQIDLDRQIARVRVTRPMELDFAWFGEAIVRNNMGVGGFRLYVSARFEKDAVVLNPGGQRFPLVGGPPGNPSSDPRWFEVRGWKSKDTVGLDPEGP